MAPELFENDCHYGPSIDVYAFSMIAFEIVSGEIPFKEFIGLSASARGDKIVKGIRPKIQNHVPEKMAKLIRRCWRKEAESRPSFADTFSAVDPPYYER